MTKLEVRKEIKRIVETLKREYKPEKIILFGSVARGKMTPDSDVDLFIVKKTKKHRVERAREVYRLLDYHVPLDVVVFTPLEVKKRLKLGDFFVNDILSEGKVLYERKGSPC